MIADNKKETKKKVIKTGGERDTFFSACVHTCMDLVQLLKFAYNKLQVLDLRQIKILIYILYIS